MSEQQQAATGQSTMRKDKERAAAAQDLVVHPFPPLYDAHSQILILGSFPSVRSREQMFFYGHPQNRFWKVLAAVFEDEVPQTVPEKRAFLLAHHVALWDVIASCRIMGSSDASIRDVQPNDIRRILDAAPIGRIFVNGAKAGALYRKYQQLQCGREAVALPSTSPANAACSLEKLIAAWSVIRE